MATELQELIARHGKLARVEFCLDETQARAAAHQR
jgi:hypothetical protein